MAASLEVELKLRADDDAPLQHLASVPSLGAFELGPAAEVLELDRYLDTADGSLAIARWACRLRTRGGSTRVSLKGPARHAEGATVHRRPEIEGPATDELAPASWPASAARDELQRLTGGRPLGERLALRQQRLEREVSDEGLVGTLSLDRVVVMQGGVERGSFLAVELELQPGADERLVDVLLAELQFVGGLQPEPRSKLERALALLSAAE